MCISASPVHHKEDWGTGTAAAAMGGTTTVFEMPNTHPPTRSVVELRQKQAAAAKAHVDYGLYGLLAEDNIDELPGLIAGGVNAFKCFMGNTFGNLPSPSTGAMLEGFEIIAPSGLRISLHAETASIMAWRQQRLMAAGRNDPFAHIAARPAIVAAEAVSRAAELAEWTGARIHVLHISSAAELRPLADAKARGVEITGETCPCYLLLDTRDYARLGSIIRVNPPVREASDSEAIWRALQSGVVDMIATDHAPHTPEEKIKDVIWEADCGFPGVETQMPLMLDQVSKGRMTLEHYVRISAENPAKSFGLWPPRAASSPARRPTSPSSTWSAPRRSGHPACIRGRGSRRSRASRSRACRSTRWCGAASCTRPAAGRGHQRLGPPGHRHPEDAAPDRAQRRPDARGLHRRNAPDGGSRRMNAMSVVEPAAAPALIEFQESSVTFGRGAKAVQALAPTSLKIAEGDFVALVGPSGCGKSTILKMVGELLKPSTGHVFVAGREIGANPDPHRHGLPEPDAAALADDPRQHHAPLKIVPPFRQEYRAKKRGEFRARVEALLDQVGLGGFGDKYPWQLSGGMMQRANLCRALVHDPDLLLLDEPFGALDQFTREELWATMQDLWLSKKGQAKQLTVLLVTHDLKEAAFLANRNLRDERAARPHPSTTASSTCRAPAPSRRRSSPISWR